VRSVSGTHHRPPPDAFSVHWRTHAVARRTENVWAPPAPRRRGWGRPGYCPRAGLWGVRESLGSGHAKYPRGGVLLPIWNGPGVGAASNGPLLPVSGKQVATEAKSIPIRRSASFAGWSVCFRARTRRRETVEMGRAHASPLHCSKVRPRERRLPPCPWETPHQLTEVAASAGCPSEPAVGGAPVGRLLLPLGA